MTARILTPAEAEAAADRIRPCAPWSEFCEMWWPIGVQAHFDEQRNQPPQYMVMSRGWPW